VSADYLKNRLPDTLPDDPLPWVEAWLLHARQMEIQPNPNAMTLSTIDAGGLPSSRVVLCKILDVNAGVIVFFTNYSSRKARELFANPNVCLNFHWDGFGKQIRVEGMAVRSPDAESDAYFASRPLGSQLGAWTSDQSAPLASREALQAQFLQRAKELGVTLDAAGVPIPGSVIPRPEHWGGIRVHASAIELWVDGEHRIHDRARWTRELTVDVDGHVSSGPWSAIRLQP
jgi:pyridoxamine 5'-phosphate oxidase